MAAEDVALNVSSDDLHCKGGEKLEALVRKDVRNHFLVLVTRIESIPSRLSQISSSISVCRMHIAPPCDSEHLR